jgi:hypothetical protein
MQHAEGEAMIRFAVEWFVPAEPDRLTHVLLLDKERPAPYTLAVGHGKDKVNALLSLWKTLLESDVVPEAIDFVAVEYKRHTGKEPVTAPD